MAHWLVENLQPECVVELGSHYGVSFFAFCEAAELWSKQTYIYAIDTWKGDEHAGYYDNEVFNKVSIHQQKYHAQRSQLIRSTFAKAAEQFSDGSLDLIHIDGLHTYEAVRRDYDEWKVKLKHGGSVIFHDWNVREDRVQKERENVASEAAQWRRGLTMHRREQGSSSKVSALTAP